MKRRTFLWLTTCAIAKVSVAPAFGDEKGVALEATFETEELLKYARTRDIEKVGEWLRQLIKEILNRGEGLTKEEHQDALAVYEEQEGSVNRQINGLAEQIIETYGSKEGEAKARKKPKWRLKITLKFRPPEIGIVIDWP